jgi:1-acyl-sn-glycerol-3-phosphate acyltransferase
MIYSILRSLAFLILKIFFRLEKKGMENIPKKGGFILASNHSSYLDPIAVGAACPRKLNYMAKHDLFAHPLFAWLLYRIKVFPVKRNSPDISALKEAIKRVEKGGGLLLFPEGRRRVNEVPGELQPGIGFLAAKLDVPVIPAFVRGTETAWPKGAKFIRLNKISVYFGRQVFLERRAHYHDIVQRIMQEIQLLS